MKKRKILSVILAAIMILSVLAACSDNQKEPENPTPSNPAEDVSDTTEPTSDEEEPITLTEAEEVNNDYLYELYHYEGERIIQNEKVEYKFRLPQLKSTSPQAEEINKKIIDRYEKLIKEQIEYTKDPDIWHINIYWQSYINDGLLSIVVFNDTFATEFIEYSVYLFDTDTEKAVSNSELLARAGISEDDFISKAKATAEELFSKVDFGNIDGAEEFRKKLLDYMLSEDNISINTPMFIDDSGTLNAIVKIGQAGGADYKYEIIEIK